MSDVERRITNKLVAAPELVAWWHDPLDKRGNIEMTAPEVRRLIEAAYSQGWSNCSRWGWPGAPLDWDALLGSVREEGKP